MAAFKFICRSILCVWLGAGLVLCFGYGYFSMRGLDGAGSLFGFWGMYEMF